MLTDTAEKIEKHEQTRREALLSGDKAALDSLLSEDLVFFHLSGAPDNKAGFAATIDRMRPLNIDIIQRDIAVYGDAAIVTSEERIHAKLVDREDPITLHARIMAVYANEGGDWRLVRFQGTPIGQFRLDPPN
jgi:ketosteroid isomerase-like protein